MNYSQIYYKDMVNGEGVRTTLFVSGCDHGCKGCYNQSTWNPKNGKHFGAKEANEVLDSLAPKHVAGLSLTGGDPLYAGNLEVINALIQCVRGEYGDTKDIWLWTGYTLKEIEEGAATDEDMLLRKLIIDQVDVLIDGKFEKDKHEHGLPFRGSTNQIIHRFTEF